MYSVTVQRPVLPCPGEHLKLHPLCNRCAKRKKKKRPNEEQIKAPEKIQLSNEEIANLSDAQFKTLVIRKLTELVEFGRKLDEKMKAMPRETKENVQGTNSDGKETGAQINGVDQKEERNNQTEKNEETRIQKKMRRGLGTYRTTFSVPISKSWGHQKEKRKSNKLKTYLKT